MKVLQIVHRFAADSLGGVELYSLGLAQALKKRGIDSGFAQPMLGQGAMTWRHSQYQGLALHQLDLPQEFSLAELYDNRAAAGAVLDMAEEQGYEAIHVHHLMVFTARLLLEARRRGWPLVMTLHDFWMLCYSPNKQLPTLLPCPYPLAADDKWCLACLVSQFGHRPDLLTAQDVLILKQYHESRKQLHRQALEAVHRLAAVSRYVADEFASYLGSKPLLVRPGIGGDMTAAKPRPPLGRIRLVMLGGLNPAKGALPAVRAMARVEQAQLHIYGAPGEDEGYRRKVEAALAAAPGRLFYHGLLPPQERAAVLAEADAVMVPSWNEVYGLVAREASATGKPVLCSNSGGLAEGFIHDQNALLFAPGDEDAMAQAVERLVREPDLLINLTRNVKPPHGIDHDAAIYAGLYAEAFTSAGRKSP